MKLWGGRFADDQPAPAPDPQFEKFSESFSFDQRLILYDLRVNRRIGILVGLLAHDHARRALAQSVLEALHIVAPIVVVERENGDLRVRPVRQDVLGV